MQSVRSRLVNAVLRRKLAQLPPGPATADALAVAQDASTASHAPPPKVAQRARIAERPTAVGWPCYELTVDGVEPLVDVIHLHGGGYVSELSSAHWQLALRLAQVLRARVFLPVYPLTPRATAGPVVAEGLELVDELITTADRPVLLSGDSAGGGLALAVAVGLRDAGRQLPAHLALQAPWIDLTVDNPALIENSRLDPLADVPYLVAAAEAYAGGLPLEDPRVSPILADLTGLPPTSVHIGGSDMFLHDSRNFADRARAAGVTTDLHVLPGQVHGYWVLPTPEAKRFRRDLADVVRRLTTGSA